MLTLPGTLEVGETQGSSSARDAVVGAFACSEALQNAIEVSENAVEARWIGFGAP
jgi:hypothetical protein